MRKALFLSILSSILFLAESHGMPALTQNASPKEEASYSRETKEAILFGLGALGLKEEDLAIDKWVGETNMTGKYPRIRKYFDQPFLLIPESEALALGLTDEAKTISAILEKAMDWLPEKPRKASPSEKSDLAKVLASVTKSDTQHPLDKSITDQIAQMPEDLRQGVAIILDGFAQAAQYRSEALATIDKDDFISLQKALPSLVNDAVSVAKETDDRRQRIGRLIGEIDFPKLLGASLILAQAIEKGLPKLSEAVARMKGKDMATFECSTPLGAIRIGGLNDDTYKEGAALHIDLGGNDTYEAVVGSSRNSPCGVSLCLDLSGDDIYKTHEDWAQGSALMGIGMLIDMGGNDTYEAGNFSQGSSLCGVGLLMDEAGDDTYQARNGTQGMGMLGLGILIDRKGKDAYTSGTMSQGYGTVQGLGFMLDVAGDDTYSFGSWSHGVSAGRRLFTKGRDSSGEFYGGIGFFIDRGGNDLHQAVGSVQQSIASAYFYGIGIVYDFEGNDTYQALSNWYGSGGAAHYGLSLFVDRSGDDTYKCGHMAIAYDNSVSLTIDQSGNDTYSIERMSWADAGTPSKSIFVDLKGDDTYTITKIFVSGGETATVVQLDMEGKDRYTLPKEITKELKDGERIMKQAPPKDGKRRGGMIMIDQ